MAVITFPSSLGVEFMSWTLHRNDITYRSIFGAQAIEVSAPQWMVTVESGQLREDEAGEWKALMLRLRGSIDQLELWDHARPVPKGTLRGTLTLRTALAQGDTTLKLQCSPTQSGATLLPGDWLGFGTGLSKQLVMVVEAATVNGSGELDVKVQPAARAAHSAGAAVTWDKPTALFRRMEPDAGWTYENVMAGGFRLTLIEDPRP